MQHLAGTQAHLRVSHDYEDDSLILLTRFELPSGDVVMRDFFCTDHEAGVPPAPSRLVRMVECVRGEVALALEVRPRFDFGTTIPALREHGDGIYTAFGSNQGLLIRSEAPLVVDLATAGLKATIDLEAGQRLALVIRFLPPEQLATAVTQARKEVLEPERDLALTRRWWSAWAKHFRHPAATDRLTRRSALALKGLCFERTGAIAAATTTSLPESPGGERNWDYRYSWIRDSVFTVKALHTLGFDHEAGRFSNFIERRQPTARLSCN